MVQHSCIGLLQSGLSAAALAAAGLNAEALDVNTPSKDSNQIAAELSIKI